MGSSHPSGNDPEPAERDYPGKKLGILGLIMSCVIGAVGLVISSIALVVSLRARHRNAPALAGVIIGFLTTTALVLGIAYFASFWEGSVGPCAELGPGVHREGLITYSCE